MQTNNEENKNKPTEFYNLYILGLWFAVRAIFVSYYATQMYLCILFSLLLVYETGCARELSIAQVV
jgi:hypothetical protein